MADTQLLGVGASIEASQGKSQRPLRARRSNAHHKGSKAGDKDSFVQQPSLSATPDRSKTEANQLAAPPGILPLNPQHEGRKAAEQPFRNADTQAAVAAALAD